MSSKTRILITGGGTGGHVYPGLAVAEALSRLHPDVEVRFAGTRRGLESVLVPRAGFHLYQIPASGFRGLGAAARLAFVVNFALGFLRSLFLMMGWRPAVVLGTGGYVSAPVMSAAKFLGIACCLQEQNAIPGSTNRLVARWAKRIYVGPKEAAKFFKSGLSRWTGNPVRAAFLEAARGAETTTTAGPTASPGRRVLVFGGSRGAHSINMAVLAAAQTWLAEANLGLWIQTGVADHAQVQQAYAEGDNDRLRVVPYIEDMPAALAWADLVVCRAGAMTLAELQLTGRAAILVPFPHATDQHQLLNAQACRQGGAARVLEDKDCQGDKLAQLVLELLADPAALRRMAEAAKTMGRPEAAGIIALDLLELAGHTSGRRMSTLD